MQSRCGPAGTVLLDNHTTPGADSVTEWESFGPQQEPRGVSVADGMSALQHVLLIAADTLTRSCTCMLTVLGAAHMFITQVCPLSLSAAQFFMHMLNTQV